MRIPLPLLIALPAISPTAAGADRYVSVNGFDTNAGTLAAPYRTIQKGVNVALPGDTIHVRGLNAGGTQAVFAERVVFNSKSGAVGTPIVLRAYTGDVLPGGGVAMPAVDQTGVTPPNDASALLLIQNSSHLVISGIEWRNYSTTSSAKIPVGILVTGTCQNVRIERNLVHHIWQSNTTASGNGFGIAAYGTGSIDGLVLDGNEVHSLRTGQSESIVLNGNVTNFQVVNNIVHDCNNIGIDFIGYEGAHANAALDRARNGVCAGNVVYNINSEFNPGYGGSFTSGGGDRSAPGLYVDGGANIVMERNHVHHCNIGVSIGSEHAGRNSDAVVLRNNLIRNNDVGGLFLGGANATDNGGATNVSVTNNTFYRNDEDMFGGGCVEIQNRVSGTTIQNNIFVAQTDGSGWGQFILKTNSTGSFAANAIDWNLYSGPSASSNLEFIWNDSPVSSFGAWRTASAQDGHSTFTTASLGFTNAGAGDFTLLANSIARNAGNTAFVPAAGEKDFGGQTRVVGGRVDIGMDEYLDPWQAWRDLHFGLPEGGAGANALDDPERDGAVNLMEFSQGMNPNVADAALLPTVARNGASVRFRYRKAGAGVTYLVEQSGALSVGWITAVAPEQTDGSGNYWRDIPIAGSRQHIRLRVTMP